LCDLVGNGNGARQKSSEEPKVSLAQSGCPLPLMRYRGEELLQRLEQRRVAGNETLTKRGERGTQRRILLQQMPLARRR
jgi:hypothetical protein